MGLAHRQWTATHLIDGGGARPGGSRRLGVLWIRLFIQAVSLHSMVTGKPGSRAKPDGNSDLDAGSASRAFNTALLVQLSVVVAPTFGLQRQSVRFPSRGLGHARASPRHLGSTPAKAGVMAFSSDIDAGLSRWPCADHAWAQPEFVDSTAMELGHRWDSDLRSLDVPSESVALSVVTQWRGPKAASQMFPHLGDNLGDILFTLVSRPWLVLTHIDGAGATFTSFS